MKILLDMAVDLSLTNKQRDVVRLYYSEGKKVSEIAELLGICESGVYKILKRAIKKLDKCKKIFLKSGH